MMISRKNSLTEKRSREKIGLFFGSFNPIHVGHLIISNSMIENGNLDKVWFVVTPTSPSKKNKNLLHQFDRYDLVKAAIADNYKLAVSDIEFSMPKPYYTAHTLAYLAEKFPDKEFILIMGEDNMQNFPKWKNHTSILSQYQIYVYPRPNATGDRWEKHPNIKGVDAPVLNISATYIRQAIKNRKSIRYLVPQIVEDMIRTKGFYLS